VAYATDCVICGTVALERDRLTDLLSHENEYDLDAVSLEVLSDSRIVVFDTTKVLRQDLCVVAATGPRGNAGRRVRTRPHPVRARVGPYDVFGYIHAMPTADVLSVARRRSIIPMTSGRIGYVRGDEVVERRHDGMLVVRDKIDWLEEATSEDAGLAGAPELPMRRDRRARDLTGHLFES
jgi:hypothetical protein